MAELHRIIVFYGRHFNRHLGICNRIYDKLLQRMSGIIAHSSVRNEVSILINGWVTANYSISRPPFCSPLEFVIRIVPNFYRLCPVLFCAIFIKNDFSITNRFSGVHKRGIHIHSQTHTYTYKHNDSIRRNAVRCISSNNWYWDGNCWSFVKLGTFNIPNC